MMRGPETHEAEKELPRRDRRGKSRRPDILPSLTTSRLKTGADQPSPLLHLPELYVLGLDR